MRQKTRKIIAVLNNSTKFPWHGVANVSDGSAVLISPFIRAILELQLHNEHLSRGYKITINDFRNAFCFQDLWYRLVHVMSKLTALESRATFNEMEIKGISSINEFPFWLDLFHLYVPLLLDAGTVSLGLIISDAPKSFPKQFKKMFKSKSDVSTLKLRCDENCFLDLLAEGRGLHDIINPGNSKSVRDSISHRLTQWRLGIGKERLYAKLEGVADDISTQDGLDEAGEIMVSICEFYSKLPSQTWMKNEFDVQDLLIGENLNQLGGRFFPQLPNVLELDD